MADDQQYQDENRSAAKTLWLGDVQPDWTEEYVESLFSSIVGQELEVKLIRDRHRGIVAGYGFIDFRNHETAQLVLDSLNGKPIEGTSLRYRLNWGAGGKRIEQAPEYSVFVGDLSPEVTDTELKATFLDKYASVLGAKVVTNPMTGSSKSFGFIRFGDEQERDEALTAMNGAECCGRPIRVAPATKRTSVQGQTGAHATDPSNTTVFVGGINDSVTEKVLRDTFNSAGEIQTVTTPPGRGCAFVTFAHRASAEHVINNMQGTTVCGSCVRLSWGKSGRADRDRDRERAGGDPIMGMGGIQSSPTVAAAAAAAARGAPFSGLYGHPQSYASFNGAYPANLFPAGAVYGGAYPQPGQQQPGLPPPAAAGTGQQLPQAQQPQQPHQHQQAAQQQVAAQQQQQQQQQQAAQQQYAQPPYSQQSYAPYQGFGFQQYPAQQQAAYTSFNGNNTAYAQDPSALATDLSQLSLSGGAASAVGSTSGGASVGGGGRAARVGGSRSGGGGGGGGGMYGPASRSGGQGQGPGPGQGGQGPSFSLQDVRKGGLGPASRN